MFHGSMSAGIIVYHQRGAFLSRRRATFIGAAIERHRAAAANRQIAGAFDVAIKRDAVRTLSERLTAVI